MSQESTFQVFLSPRDEESIERILFEMADGVAFRLRGEGLWGRTITLKVRDEHFKTCTRSITLDSPTRVVEDIFAAALRLFRERVRLGNRKIRLLGVGVAALAREPLRQLDLFDAGAGDRERAESIARVSDAIREKLGDGAITRGRLLSRRTRRGRKR